MSTETYRTRLGEPGDAVTMCRIHHRCWTARFADLVANRDAVDGMDPEGNLDRFVGWLEPTSVADVTVAWFGTDSGGRVVGYSTVIGHELVHLMIDPEHAGRGVGRTLLAAAEQLMADAGHTTFELHTMVGNVPAIALYESAGWQMTDRLVHTDDGDDGVSYDEHVMLKHLP